jgi:peptide/nickel transport system permease protein
LFLAVFGVSIITFVVTRVLPGNPAYLIVGVQADQSTVDAVIDKLGLDKPIIEQYHLYMKQLFLGDFGTSWRTGNPVSFDLSSRWPATIELSSIAMIIAIIWAIPLGLISSIRKKSISDYIAKFLSGLGVAIPEFWLATLLILIFFAGFQIAPAPIGRILLSSPPESITGMYILDSIITANWESLRASVSQIILPASTLAFTIGAPLLRVTRTFMKDVLDSQYIRSARAMGIPKMSIIFRHAFPNVLLPVSTMIAVLYGYLLGGTVLVEYVFSWPGMGKYAIDSINSSDYAPVMAVVVLSAVSYLLVYLLTDILHFFVDPRSR